MDDAGAAGAAAQVHARVPDFVLQQLIQLPAQLFHQLSHLGNTQKRFHLQKLSKQLRSKLITLSSLISDLMRRGSEPDPSVVEGDDKLSLVQLHVDLPTSEQHQRVDGHHAAVPDEDTARFHLLVVNQVGTVVVANLEHKKNSHEACRLTT